LQNSVQAMKKVGIDLAGYRSQELTQALAGGALAIFCMTEAHRAMIQLNYDPEPRHVYLFREFLKGDVEREIGDPYGGPLSTYELCRDEMVEALPSLVEFIRGIAKKS
jgi:protein-tyrosine phosphatase